MAVEQNCDLRQRVGLYRSQSEAILLPVTSDIGNVSMGISLAAGFICLESDGDSSRIVRCFQPDITFVCQTFLDRNPSLADAAPLAVLPRDVDSKRMLRGKCILVASHGTVHAGVPGKLQVAVVVTVVGIAFPVTRQSNRVGSLVESSIAN